MNKQYWEVTVWDSTIKIKQLHIPINQISADKLQDLLRVLTAKHSLTDEEIAKCFLKRNTKSYLPFLAVRKDTDDALRTTSYICGENPHSYARIVSAENAL